MLKFLFEAPSKVADCDQASTLFEALGRVAMPKAPHAELRSTRALPSPRALRGSHGLTNKVGPPTRPASPMPNSILSCGGRCESWTQPQIGEAGTCGSKSPDSLLPPRWLSRKYHASVINLKEFYEDNIGKTFTGIISNALNKNFGQNSSM